MLTRTMGMHIIRLSFVNSISDLRINSIIVNFNITKPERFKLRFVMGHPVHCVHILYSARANREGFLFMEYYGNISPFLFNLLLNADF